MTTLAVLGIYFAQGTSGYYGGALAVVLVLFVLSILSSIILKGIPKHDKNEWKKRTFADTFNWQGYVIGLGFAACIAGIVTGSVLGAKYGKNHNETNTDQDDNYINKEENRIIGTLIAVLSGITLLVMIRIIFVYGVVRGMLDIPDKIAPEPTPAPEPNPTPTPANQRQPEASTSNNQKDQTVERVIETLSTQNNLLKEENRLQREQLEQITALNAELQQLAVERQTGPTAPPPAYQSLDAVSPPGHVVQAWSASERQ